MLVLIISIIYFYVHLFIVSNKLSTKNVIFLSFSFYNKYIEIKQTFFCQFCKIFILKLGCVIFCLYK